MSGKLAVALLVVCSLAPGADPVDPAGDWKGLLDNGTARLRFLVHVQKSESGTFKICFSSPDQGATFIPVDVFELKEGHLTWQLRAADLSFDGTIDPSARFMDAKLIQRGKTTPLRLERQTPSARRRPQEPKPPFPYRAESVSYPNPKAEGVRLAGTLTLPPGEGPFPAVLLITGSGPQNRDEEILGHKPFLVLADALTRRGIAVLRVDDRGVAESTGNFALATTADFATDAEAGVDFLLHHSRIDAKHVGVLGHSEGGAIAPMVALARPQVAFVVLLAGQGVRGEDIIVDQVYQGARLSGASEEQAQQARKTQQGLLDVVKSAPDPNDRRTRLLEYAQAHPGLEGQLRKSIPALLSPWYRYYILYDPAGVLMRVKAPVLALNGTKDSQVSADLNLPAIEKWLRQGGNRDVTITRMPGLNHLFQHCNSGLVTEYEEIEETMSPEVLQIIGDWILAHARL